MKTIIELIEETKKGINSMSIDLAYNNYDSSAYISDAISEEADSNTSIYYSDIIKFISENVEKVNDTIEEFGWDGCGSDLYKAGQMAEYRDNEVKMWEDEDSIRTLALLYNLKDDGITAIDEDLFDDWSKEVSMADRFDEIADTFQELLAGFVYSCEDHEEDASKIERKAA